MIPVTTPLGLRLNAKSKPHDIGVALRLHASQSAKEAKGRDP
jgi:hypothetical protein